jgi:hypothetical protein
LQTFLKSLSRVQQNVAWLLAEGLNNNAIASRRNKSVHTVKKQISDIFAEWRIFWGLPENAPVRDQIVAELSGYFARRGQRKGGG